MTITPLQFACSGKAPVSRAVPLSMSMSIGYGQKIAANKFYAARPRRPLSNDVLEHLFFLFFFHVRNSLLPYVHYLRFGLPRPRGKRTTTVEVQGLFVVSERLMPYLEVDPRRRHTALVYILYISAHPVDSFFIICVASPTKKRYFVDSLNKSATGSTNTSVFFLYDTP